MLVPVREFTSAAELRASVIATRARLAALRPPPPPPPILAPRYVHVHRKRSFELSRRRPQKIAGEAPRRPSPAMIVREVASFYRINTADILAGPGSGLHVIFQRQVAMYLMHRMTLLSLLEIARQVNKTDHSTVVHAVKVIKDIACKEWTFAHDLCDIMIAIDAAISGPLAHGGVAYGGHRAPAAVGPSAGAPGGAR